MIYPIGFSIPECKLVCNIHEKNKLYATIIPGVLRTYIYNNEESYYNDYRNSVFGKTTKKAGWDCLRHYEILANGCIPWFDDLEKCPPQTMTHFPKGLILDAMHTLKDIKDITDLSIPIINKYSTDLLEYTRNNLTTKAMAKYILNTTGFPNAKSVLFISNSTDPDYQRCLTLHGFKELFGAKCHDSPCIPHLYTNYGDSTKLYGKGISYTCLLDIETTRNAMNDSTLLKDIADHKYDIIIYGSIHRGTPYWDIVNMHYNPNEIILICGEDIHNCDMSHLGNKYPLFIREL